MSKIDTSKIEGYAEMTAEQKLAALEAFEQETDYSGYIKKDIFDKTASELAAKKKELDAARTDEEKKKAEQDEQFKTISEELTRMKAEKALADYTAEFLTCGFEKGLAATAAKALQEGDYVSLFASIGKFKESYKTEVLSSEFGSTQKPPPGDPSRKNEESVFSKYQRARQTGLTEVDLKNRS